MQSTTEKRDWLAIILIGMGSSFARGPDREDSIDRVVKLAASDWGGLYDLSEKDVSVNVYDVTGHDRLYWDERGVFAQGPGTYETSIERDAVETRTFPKVRRRRSR